jgi:hypothetical protein
VVKWYSCLLKKNIHDLTVTEEPLEARAGRWGHSRAQDGGGGALPSFPLTSLHLFPPQELLSHKTKDQWLGIANFFFPSETKVRC